MPCRHAPRRISVFETGMFAGSTGSLTVLGAPDIILLTLTEFAAQAYRINRACEMPLLVDADHGYGNALNVQRTVEELETAGVSCMTIEDTLLPQAFAAKGQSMLSLQEGVGKMKGALAGRQDPKLIILGRTSAVQISTVDDAIERAKAYADVGVDGIMFTGVTTRQQLDLIARAVKVPIMLGGVPADMQDLDYLSDCGVRISLQGHQPIAAAYQAMYSTLKALRDGVKPADLTGLPSKELTAQLTRAEQYKAAQDDFLN